MNSKRQPVDAAEPLQHLLHRVHTCRICIETPRGPPLPHVPRPVLRASTTARIAVCGQAPGTRVHASGIPFTDPSGDRLRSWMGVSADEFYDVSRIAIVPMGFCFPGLDAKGADRPPRRECAGAWHTHVFELMPQLDLFLLVGMSALRWHIPDRARTTLTETVAHWREISGPIATRTHARATVFPAPHPSWRNNRWLKTHAWFDNELLPDLQREVRLRLLPQPRVL
jgi:uracil-DNA glycosylase